MKKLIIIILLFSTGMMQAQDSVSRFTIPINNWNMQVVARENFYPTYLADPVAIRFGVSSQTMKYSDFDHSDRINTEGTYLGKLIINPGVRFSVFKFSPNDNPNLGIEVDLGVTIPTIMRAGNHDVIGMDGNYYFAIAGRPTEWLSLRFSKHHICTHIGDEFLDKVYSPSDFDFNIYQLPVRDDFILSAAVKPLYFLGNKDLNILQVYGDFGFYMPGTDFMGGRQNKSNPEAYLNLQGGAEIEYYLPNKYMGGVFSALNVSAYQNNAFSPNISYSIGYIIPQERDKRKLRMGLNWYNGRSWSNQFFNRKEKFVAFFLEMDV
ncbi:MAG: DUF1207 domain-containing protein [Bacteroidales bacterium]|nr:DUF1207 domain-containing protein [Bacteroidales bacterium]